MAITNAYMEGLDKYGVEVHLGMPVEKIIVEDGKHAAYANKLLEKGVIGLTAGKNAVRLLPPLTISKEEMDEALTIMKEVF